MPRLRSRIFGFFILIASLTLTMVFALSPDRLFNDSSESYIEVADEALVVQYGVYSEVEIKLENSPGGLIEWEAIEGSMPAGMDLEESNQPSILLFGTPLFTESWCFALGAKIGDEMIAQRRICITSEDNPELSYPRFVTERFLPDATLNQFYQQTVEANSESTASIRGTFTDGLIPPGLTIEAQDSSKRFLIKGRPTDTGIFLFALKIEDLQSGIQSYKQFQLAALDPVVEEDPVCPPGYYYDSILRRCIQSEREECPDGTYYDPESESCVAYPPPPPTVRCPAGYYFDPYLSTCVRAGYPRCPINHAWDPYYNRCVRQVYDCPVGYRYNWHNGRCEYVWAQRCGPYSYWDPYRGRCVDNIRSCRPGWYWHTPSQQCRPNSWGCRANEYWDPYARQCRPNRPHCRWDEHYDPRTNRCVYRRPPARNCPPGHHWVPHRNRCERNANPPPPTRPMPPPMHRPPPMPAPMNPPMPRPDPMPTPMPPPMNPPPMPRPDPMPTPMPPPMNPPPMPRPDPMPAPMPPPMNPPPMPRPDPMPAPMPPAMNPPPMPMPNPMGRRMDNIQAPASPTLLGDPDLN